MSAIIFRFPSGVPRGVPSRKPRAAKAPAGEVAAERQPYQGNPLRAKIVTVSRAATIAGRVNYQSRDLSRIGPIGEPHVQELRIAAEEARHLASEFERAAGQIMAGKPS
jgi:hypothetical protein